MTIENMLDPKGLQFYGATKIGERGQMVIPTDARKDLNITTDTKLMVFGNPNGFGLMVLKSEFVTDFLSKATEMLKGLEQATRSEQETP